MPQYTEPTRVENFRLAVISAGEPGRPSCEIHLVVGLKEDTFVLPMDDLAMVDAFISAMIMARNDVWGTPEGTEEALRSHMQRIRDLKAKASDADPE